MRASDGALMVCLAMSSGCVALDELTSGVALWPLLLGTQVEAEHESLLHLTAAEVIVAVVDVEERSIFVEQFPIEGAELRVSGPGLDGVVMEEIGSGLYWLTSAHELALRYEEGATYTVEAVIEDEVYSVEAPAGALLPGVIGQDIHAANKTLRIEMPAGYEDDFDQVLTQVVDATALNWDEPTWSNRPVDALGWIAFATDVNTPPTVALSGEAFPEQDNIYGASLLGLARSREAAVWSENLRSELSGFTTGSGYVRPVQTAQ